MHPPRLAGEAFDSNIMSWYEAGVESHNGMVSGNLCSKQGLVSVDEVRWLMCQRGLGPILAAGRPGGLVRAW